uniref:Uncharacterized protein n=1 Tax=Arundo donax TaxID=35708 RepID=A0A0A8ZLZ3_ARUDO
MSASPFTASPSASCRISSITLSLSPFPLSTISSPASCCRHFMSSPPLPPPLIRCGTQSRQKGIHC